MSDLYRNFDLEQVMDSEYYANHVSAMTGENLNSKMDIAAELAHIDNRIAELERERMVKIPQTADEAKSMYLVALKWLQDNAPNELNQAKKQHNTEQQIKALIDINSMLHHRGYNDAALVVGERIEQLRKGVGDE